MDKARIEAFSDGVFAIAITLLVLDLHVPEVGSGSLAHALGHQWPADVSYVVSFLTIGIIWVNHHDLMRHLDHCDRGLLLLNVLFLMIVARPPLSDRARFALRAHPQRDGRCGRLWRDNGGDGAPLQRALAPLHPGRPARPGSGSAGGLGHHPELPGRAGALPDRDAAALVSADASLVIFALIAIFYVASARSGAAATSVSAGLARSSTSRPRRGGRARRSPPRRRAGRTACPSMPAARPTAAAADSAAR